MWFYEPGVLESNELIGLGRALQSAARKPPLRDGRIVAALSFGFWIALLSGRYEQRLWQPDRFALQRFVFPHAVGFSQQQISQRFNGIAKLRNRCFHHEGIWHWATLQQDHEDIHEAIGWISPTLQQAILSVDNFGDVFGGRDQVKADLAQRFGLA
jgi:hypothetical protein